MSSPAMVSTWEPFVTGTLEEAGAFATSLKTLEQTKGVWSGGPKWRKPPQLGPGADDFDLQDEAAGYKIAGKARCWPGRSAGPRSQGSATVPGPGTNLPLTGQR